MNIPNAFEIASTVIPVVSAFAALILVLGEQKAIIARNRRRIERLENSLEASEKNVHSLNATVNNIQIKLHHVENYLDRTTDFAPVITRTDFDFDGR